MPKTYGVTQGNSDTRSAIRANDAAPVGARITTPRAAVLLGPAMVAGVAYLDPGNVASNMSAGAKYGFLLIWVVVLANLIAWLVQYLSAKLGVVTGESLPEILGRKISSNLGRRLFWLQAEIVAAATDLAEVVGGAIALNILFGLPLIVGGIITGAVSLALLILQSQQGVRAFEFVVIGLIAIIVIGFTLGVFINPPSPEIALAGLIPRFADMGSVLLAASIMGATIMPHAIYAHSALSRDRFAHTVSEKLPKSLLLRATKLDVSVAMTIAGGVNIAMLLLAATSLYGVSGTDTIDGAYQALRSGMGQVVATLFAVGLLASGLASTSVGAYAGAEIMHGLLRRKIPLAARRFVTILPALAVLLLGIDPTYALIISQVVLSFGIPFALIPLVWLTAKTNVLGTWRNRITTTVLGVIAAAILTALNVALLWMLL